MLKITAKTLKPRNPLVAPSLFRKAGKHELAGRVRRRQAQHALRRELQALEAPAERAGP